MATYDITIYAGSTFTLPITIRNKACKTGIDLTDAIITANIHSGSPQPQFSIVNNDISNGSFIVKMFSAETSALSLTNNTSKYSVKIQYSGSPEDIDIVLTGRITLIEDD